MPNDKICWLVLTSTTVWLHNILFLHNLFRYDTCLILLVFKIVASALRKVFSLYGMYQCVCITMVLLIMSSVILLIYIVHFLNKRFPNLNLTILSRVIFQNIMWHEPFLNNQLVTFTLSDQFHPWVNDQVGKALLSATLSLHLRNLRVKIVDWGVIFN